MLKRVFPFLEWFKGYNTSTLRADFLSGLTVALVLIPQSMAYAQLAGLPPYYGLYASFLPPMIAALFGSSRQLATGPVAVVSLLTAATLEPLATAGSEAYIAYAILLALLVGLFQFSLGVLRLGVVVNFLSHPVIIGFTNAAAIIIATSQLSKMFGVSVDKADHHYETIWCVFEAALNFTHWPTFILGALAFAIMIVVKKLNPKLPYVLVAVVVTTVISWAIGFESNREATIDQIDSSELREKIETFNADVNDVVMMSETRTFLGPDLEKFKASNPDLCMSCHAEHQVDLDMLRSDMPAGVMLRPKTALQLHAMAGLLDKQIGQIKQRTSETRMNLRTMEFELKMNGDSPRFVPLTEHKNGKEVWRLKVGNKPLDKTKLVFVGGGEVIGSIPSGIPSFSAPKWDSSIFGKLFIAAIIISILGFMEAVSIAKAMAARTGQRLDPNQELIGQGVANIIGSFGQSYAVSGSFSRSAVNIQAGATTGMSSVFTSGLVVLVLLFFTPLLYHLPQSVLAAVIMMAVIGLVNFKGVIHAYSVKRSDGIISIISFLATLVFAPHLDKGIILGVVLSVGVFLYRRMKPAVAELSLWTDGHFHSAKRLHLKQCRHLAVIRFDGPLFFANTSYLEDEVLDRVRSMPEMKAILFKSDGINEIDASGEDMLSLLIDRLRSAGYDVYFAGFNERVIDTLKRTHLYEKIGTDHIFMTVIQAIEAIWPNLHEGSDEGICPLMHVVPIDKDAKEPELRVLLVDDERDFVQTLAKRLNIRGMNADICFDGQKAIKMVRANEYDVVILDVKLGGASGEEILIKLKEIRPGLAVILLTGYATIDSVVEAMKHGASDYLLKPLDIEELTLKIRMAHRDKAYKTPDQ
jgi:MFS superfamily sulfate permease-like transporter/ActR/RegA family two-component response regulator